MPKPNVIPRAWRALWVWALAALCLGGVAGAQVNSTGQVSDVSVELTSPFPSKCSRGFVPLRVSLRNTGPDELEVRLDLYSQWTSNMAKSRQSLRLGVAPGATVQHELLMPVDRVAGNSSSGLMATCKGERAWLDADVAGDTMDVRARSIAVVSEFALSAGRLEELRLALPLESEGSTRGVFDVTKAGPQESIPRVGRGSYPSSMMVTSASRRASAGIIVLDQVATLFGVPMDQMPTRPMGWSSVDTVIVEVSRSLSSDVMSPTRWQRLVQWTKAGGQLVLVGEDLTSRIQRLEGVEALLADRLRRDVPNDVGATVYRAGLGEIALCDVSVPGLEFVKDNVGGLLRTLDRASLTEGGYPSTMASLYRASLGDTAWGKALPDDRLPIRPMLAFLVLFAVLVAPVNVAIAKARSRPGLIFFTVPLISLIATGLVIGFGIFRQGLGTKGYAHSLAIVDQVEKEVVSVLRRELVMGRGGRSLRPLPTTTVLVPDPGENGTNRSLEEDGNQLRLSGDFLPVRTRTENISLNVDTTRARLEWGFDGSGRMTVTNALGVDLVGLEIQSPGGVFFTANGRLASGESATLTEIPAPSIAAGMLPWRTEPMFDAAELPRSGFLAISDEAGPGTDDMSVPMEETHSVHAIMGYLDDSPEKWTR